MANNLIDLSDVPDSGPAAQRDKMASTPAPASPLVPKLDQSSAYPSRVPPGIAAAAVAQAPAPVTPKAAKAPEKAGGVIDLSDVPEPTPAHDKGAIGQGLEIVGNVLSWPQRQVEKYTGAETALRKITEPAGAALTTKRKPLIADVGQYLPDLSKYLPEWVQQKETQTRKDWEEHGAQYGRELGAEVARTATDPLTYVGLPVIRGAKKVRGLLGPAVEGSPLVPRPEVANILRTIKEGAAGETVRPGGGFTIEEVAPAARPAGTSQTLNEAERILTGGQRGAQRTLEAAQDLQTGRGPLDLGEAGKRMAAQRGTYQPSPLNPESRQIVRELEHEVPGKSLVPQSAAQVRVATEKAMEEGGHAAKGSLYDPADAAPGWPRAQSWLHKTIDKYREGLPANLPLLKERPDSPVITIVRSHQANRTAKAVDLIEKQPWTKAILNNAEPIEEFGPKFVRWEANGFKDAPPEIQEAMRYINQQYETEKAARLYLGDRELKETANYWPRVREQDMKAVNVRGPIRGGLVGDVRTTLGAFEKSREYPTMQVGMAKGEKYIDPRSALLIRANTGHDLIETAGMLQDMEKAGVVSRGTNAFGKDGVELFKMPTGGSWWARGPAEARAIRDELTSVQHSSLANLSHGLNTFVRNPSLVNPAVHEVKNMFYKFVISGGNPRKLAQYENEFRAAEGKFPYNIPGAKQTVQAAGVSPKTRQLVDTFLEVMPESRSATSAREVFGHAQFELEHPLASKAGSILRTPQQASHSYLFGTADPAIKYARWRQYVDKGMDAQTAANHVRIDLIDYGTRSQLIDFWKSVPGNFFVTWRTGTVQSLIKQARYHPVRTALLIGGVDYLREMAYRKTGYWLHLPIDYVEQPISRVVADARKGYQEGGVPLAAAKAGSDIASIAATTALLGPGGNPRALQNLLQVATNPADLKNIKKVFWGFAQIFDVSDALPDIMHAIDSGDTGKLAGYLQAFMAVAAFGVHKVKDDTKRPPSWTQLVPDAVPGMQRSPSQLADQEKGVLRQEQAQERKERAAMRKEQE